MKYSAKYSIVMLLLLCMAGASFGQAPDKVVIDTKDYYRHGYNKDGEAAVQTANQDWEVRDSVTVTSVMKYFVLPDPTVSPDYKYDTPQNTIDFTNVLSTFTWRLGIYVDASGNPLQGPGVLGTLNNSASAIAVVTWNTVGVDSVAVREVPKTGKVCEGGNSTVIPVAVIPKPQIGFKSYHDAAANTDEFIYKICKTQAEMTAMGGKFTYAFNMNVETASSQIKVKYTIKKDDAPASAETEAIVEKESNGDYKLTLDFTDYAEYVITITEVTDRVSRNSFDSTGNNYIVGNIGKDYITGTSNKFDFHLKRPVQTGPIYRLPNNY